MGNFIRKVKKGEYLLKINSKQIINDLKIENCELRKSVVEKEREIKYLNYTETHYTSIIDSFKDINNRSNITIDQLKCDAQHHNYLKDQYDCKCDEIENYKTDILNKQLTIDYLNSLLSNNSITTDVEYNDTEHLKTIHE